MLWTPPDDTAPDGAWVSYLADRGHRATLLISGYLMVISAGALVSFFASLYHRVDAERRDLRIPVAIGAAGVFVALGGLVWATTAGATIFGSQGSGANADVIRFEFDLGYPIVLVGGAIAMGCAILLLTLKARQAQYFGTAMTVFGYIATAACVAAVIFIPLAIVMLWALTVSVVMARRPVRTVGSADLVTQVAGSAMPAQGVTDNGAGAAEAERKTAKTGS